MAFGNHEESIIFTYQFLLLAIITVPITIALGILVYRIVFPAVLSFPWVLPPESSTCRKREKKMTVVFAGSFNPPHWGHLVMMRYLAVRYGRVICCIGVNPNKQYAVTPNKRAQILREMLKGGDDGMRCKNVDVEVVEGYIWRYAKTQKASLFFRGIRTWSADGPEERHLQILNSWGPLLLGPVWPLKTIFLEGNPKYRDVSSTMVRQLCAELKQGEKCEPSKLVHDKRLSGLIPECVLKTVVESYG